ncbi:PROTEIN GLUTAMINE DUMPER 6-LIKE [Salix viminalis]|uniref:PROTEIN GLUTAMINE DUMPER 6-LIKE n=1 Tax=Salix viminalis TaxID=40686 RepID=A0A6N2LGT3_SALVM|nr:PROTEIN GLUTAMINE DUMPER 6-LIKE [Salix viminalis]
MRASNDLASPENLWRSPIPYLFGSLGILLSIIAVALITLACSYCRKHCGNSSSDERAKPAAIPLSTPVLDAEPTIVVILAGENKPTYLAAPVNSATMNCNQLV